MRKSGVRIAREAMTPALEAALRDFVGDRRWTYPALIGGAGVPTPPDRARDLLRAQTGRAVIGAMLWVYGSVILAMSLAFVLLEHNSAERRRTILNAGVKLGASPTPLAPWSLGLAAIFLAAAVALTLWSRAKRPYGPRPTVEFLAAALPRLDLSPPERLHAETLVRAYERDDAFARSEVLPALRSLCAEWSRLDAIEAALAHTGPREGEVEALRAKLARTEDPVAREALGQSLATAERRAAAALSTRAAHERLDAHRETIVQSAHAVAETAARSRGDALDPAGDLTDLRGDVARATGDVAALEAAVQEMRAL